MNPYTLSILTGAMFSLVGLGYAIGGKRGVSPFYIGAFMYLGQALYYLPQAEFLPWHSGQAVYGAAAASGLISFLGFFIMQKGIRLGLLSSLWIALNLSFVPQTLFCVLVYDEPITRAQWAGMGLAVLCILVLSGQQKKSGTTGASLTGSRLGNALKIAAMLIGLLISNSIWLLMMKVLSYLPYPGSPNLFVKGQSLYIALQAVLLLVLTGQQVARHEPGQARFWASLPAGLVAGIGSVSGMTIIAVCVGRLYDSALCFPVYSVVGIVLVSLYSILFFGEKPDRFWVAGNALAVLCILVLLF